jgi:hypothetical protein
VIVQCSVPHLLFLRHIVNTTLPSGSMFGRDSSFSYSCMHDYQPKVESAMVYCLSDGQLSHEPECVPVSCKDHPPSIVNGRTIFQSTKHGSIARYRCFPGYRLENGHLAKVTCQFGQWLPKQPVKCLPSKSGFRCVRNVADRFVLPHQYSIGYRSIGLALFVSLILLELLSTLRYQL